MLQASGTKPLRKYIDKRQAEVAEWVDLQTIFEVCAKDVEYKGGRKLREPWCWKAAADQQVEVMLKNILAEAGERRQREFERRGGGEGG